MTAALNEVRLLAGRSLRHIPRIPEKLFGGLLMPLVFVLLFAYVFGSAIDVPGGGDYHEYLVSGIFAQSMIGTLPGISVGVASDIRSRPDGPAARAADHARVGGRRTDDRRARRAVRRARRRRGVRA